jgi:glycosyltransferase involved in cell wall biosynthesis
VKILQVVHGYPPSIGGSQVLAKNLAERWVCRYQDDVTVFTTVAYHVEQFRRRGSPTMPPGTERTNGVVVRRFPVFNRLNWLRTFLSGVAYRLKLPYNDWLRTIHNGPVVFGLSEAVAQSDADVVFAQAFPLLHMYYALAGARRADIPIVFLGAIHTADIWHYDRKMIYQAIQEADAYIAHTDFERGHLVERGIPSDKIEVIGAGVDAEAFVNTSGESVRQQFGWGEVPVVASLGKQNARKRYDVLLAAMPHVWSVYPEVQLLIAGAESSYSSQIRHVIGALPPHQRERVTIVSDFSDAQKPQLLAACDVFVLASGYESFGIAFVEAWSCAKPVIGCRIGAIPAVIDEGRDGLLVPYQEPEALARAIVGLLGEPQRRIEMGRAGQQKVMENYTWDIVAERVRDVFLDVLARRALPV